MLTHGAGIAVTDGGKATVGWEHCGSALIFNRPSPNTGSAMASTQIATAHGRCLLRIRCTTSPRTMFALQRPPALRLQPSPTPSDSPRC
jgi:hypothetical protein